MSSLEILLWVSFYGFMLLLIIRQLKKAVTQTEDSLFETTVKRILQRAKDCLDLKDLDNLTTELEALQGRGYNTVDLCHQVQTEVEPLLLTLLQDPHKVYEPVYKRVITKLHLCIPEHPVYEEWLRAQEKMEGLPSRSS